MLAAQLTAWATGADPFLPLDNRVDLVYLRDELEELRAS
jgi:hypothetical protein